MRMVSFDFNDIADVPAFYRQFEKKFALKVAFGANLDALWDAVTGMIALPVCVTLLHFEQHPERQRFAAVIDVMQQAEDETAGQFSLRVR